MEVSLFPVGEYANSTETETNDFRIRNNVVTSCSQFDKLDDVGVLPPVGSRKDLPRDLPKTHPDQ